MTIITMTMTMLMLLMVAPMTMLMLLMVATMTMLMLLMEATILTSAMFSSDIPPPGITFSSGRSLTSSAIVTAP